MEDKPIAIIIPVKNSGEYLRLTVESLFATTTYPFKIFLIESRSTDGTKEECDKLAAEHPGQIEVHHKDDIFGTTKAINYGIEVSGDMDVLLTQDDVIFHKFYKRDLLKEMAGAAKIENCGIFTVTNGGGVSGPMYINGFKWTGTWCMFISRKTLNKFGGLDENLNPGDGDDIDFSYKIYRSGLITYVTDAFVEHHRKFDLLAHEHESQEIKKKNSEYFRKKWKFDEDVVEFDILGIKRKFYKESLFRAGYNLTGPMVGHDYEVFLNINSILGKFKLGDVYLDIGAGVGDTAMWMGKFGTCYAFEPSERQYKDLLANCSLNPELNIKPLNRAAYNKRIHYQVIEGSHQGLDSIRETDNLTHPETIVLDEVFFTDNRIKLIKIDVEGAEVEVLEGAKGILMRCRPHLIIEKVHCDDLKLKRILEECNYDYKEEGVSIIASPR